MRPVELPSPRVIRILGAILAVNLFATIARAEDSGPTTEDIAFFESKVRPILVERCYSCHSADAKSVKGNLRLDTKSGWEQGGDIGPAIEPGDPDNSLLIEAVRYDGLLEMPPEGRLTDAEIAVLVDWVRRGAPDPRIESADVPRPAPATSAIDLDAAREHWAFRPLWTGEPPQVEDPENWCRNPIDRFILDRLRRAGLSPSPPADPVALIRRTNFDVIGLPPEFAEIAAFAEDPTDEAYERRIDALLARPQFGERWARHWLDLARYAESHGFEHDYDRPTAYHYRDFLVEAFNRDLPYDTFVRWQLAGDELAPEEPLAWQATGFLAAGVHSTQITASQAEKERYDELDDIVNTTGTAFLGLTIGCARCHDHKYDPIATDDYYRIVSTFTTTVRSEIDLDLDPQGYAEAKAAFDAEHAPYLDAVERFEREELPNRFAAWLQGDREDLICTDDHVWTILDLVEATSQGGATLTKQADGSVLASGTSPDHDTYVLKATVDQGGIRAVRLEALADASLVKGGPGRASNGNFALTDFKVQARPVDGSSPSVDVSLASARATFEQAGLPVAAAIDQDGTSAWAVDPRFGEDHAAIFEAAEPFGFEGGTELTVTLRFANNLKHSIGRPRLSVATGSEQPAFFAPAIAQAVVRAKRTPPDQRTPEQIEALKGWFRTIDPEFRRLREAERAHASKAPRPNIVKALVSSEGVPAVRLHTQGPDFYEVTYHLRRGDPNQKLQPAEPGVLPVLCSVPEGIAHWTTPPPEGSTTSHRRAALAHWITDVEHGAGRLLARVIVNRLWQHAFGQGIVATPSDFGKQGEPPSHPELLDWLAGELIRNDWRLKPIYKMILISSAYRQSSAGDTARAALDIENRLLWRQNPRRLEAEAIRDTMLAVAGMLDPTLHGPGTLDESMRRRSLYFTIKRSRLIPFLTLFDAPDALVPIARRSATTVAPQSLFLMNNPQVRRWAEGFADRVRSTATDAGEDRIRTAYRIALGRSPDESELSDALAFLERQGSFHQDEADADQRALTDFCQVLFGLNEFIFVP